MALLPLLFSTWLTELDRPHSLYDQHFGQALMPEQLFTPSIFNPFPSNTLADFYYRSMPALIRRGPGGMSTISTDKDTFKVILDVQQFKPEEISVKLVDRFVVIEAKHEDRRDEHGIISRQFVRKYLLPERADENQLSSNISSDGILTITAPLKQTEEKPNERTIPIEFTGKPALRMKTTEGTTPTNTPTTENENPTCMEDCSTESTTQENMKQ